LCIDQLVAVVALQSAKARLKVQEEELRSLHWEHEVLQQRFSQVCLSGCA